MKRSKAVSQTNMAYLCCSNAKSKFLMLTFFLFGGVNHCTRDLKHIYAWERKTPFYLKLNTPSTLNLKKKCIHHTSRNSFKKTRRESSSPYYSHGWESIASVLKGLWFQFLPKGFKSLHQQLLLDKPATCVVAHCPPCVRGQL